MAGYKFSSRSNDSKQEMAADATYEGMMFCPVQRAIRGKPEHHGQGRGDYGMNRYFNKKNRVKLTRLAGKGKLEAFIVPTNAMNSTQAHQVVRYFL